MLTTNVHDHADRLHSYQLIAETIIDSLRSTQTATDPAVGEPASLASGLDHYLPTPKTHRCSCLTSTGQGERVVVPDRDSGSQGRKTKRVAVRVGHFLWSHATGVSKKALPESDADRIASGTCSSVHYRLNRWMERPGGTVDGL